MGALALKHKVTAPLLAFLAVLELSIGVLGKTLSNYSSDVATVLSRFAFGFGDFLGLIMLGLVVMYGWQHRRGLKH